jgi:hypothetical protein
MAGYVPFIKSLNKFLRLSPPLKKGEIGGFPLDHLGKIPPTPLCKEGNIIYGQVLNEIRIQIPVFFCQGSFNLLIDGSALSL